MTLRVLVVDDDPLNLRIAARILKHLGHSGALATRGEKALQLAAEQAFHLMMLDINMPQGLSGLDTLTQLRRSEDNGNCLPVLMVSGQHDDSTRGFFSQAGADGFLTKPLDTAALSGELDRLRRLGRIPA